MEVPENHIYVQIKIPWFSKKTQTFLKNVISIEDALPSAPCQFGALLANLYLAMQYKKKSKGREIYAIHSQISSLNERIGSFLCGSCLTVYPRCAYFVSAFSGNGLC